MVLFDISSAFLVGGAIGWRARGKRRDLAMTAAGLGIAVPGLAFLEAFPDWDWQYILDPAGLPPGVPAIFVALIMCAALLGHWTGQRSVRSLIGAAAVFGIYCLWSLPRIPYVGTRAEFLAGEAPLFPMSFLMLLAAVGGAAVAVLATCWILAVRTAAAENP